MARLIFHRKFGYAGMTRDVVIRIDGEFRLKLGSGDRAVTSLSAGAHFIEATIGKDQSCGVDVVIDDHDEVYFICRVTRFFQPTPELQLIAKTAVQERFRLGRKGNHQKEPDPEDVEMWSGVLGVRPDATFEEIHSAYIKQMRIYHPDLTSNKSETLREIAAWKAREINMAYAKARKQLRAK
ncbi:J domain-containing protein [Methylocystis parvus]|uniref:J domain-containing protein n=1 Tax=Methylocystis parvus TaxID=134 RepID=UPI003C77A629